MDQAKHGNAAVALVGALVAMLALTMALAALLHYGFGIDAVVAGLCGSGLSVMITEISIKIIRRRTGYDVWAALGG